MEDDLIIETISSRKRAMQFGLHDVVMTLDELLRRQGIQLEEKDGLVAWHREDIQVPAPDRRIRANQVSGGVRILISGVILAAPALAQAR